MAYPILIFLVVSSVWCFLFPFLLSPFFLGGLSVWVSFPFRFLCKSSLGIGGRRADHVFYVLRVCEALARWRRRCFAHGRTHGDCELLEVGAPFADLC